MREQYILQPTESSTGTRNSSPQMQRMAEWSGNTRAAGSMVPKYPDWSTLTYLNVTYLNVCNHLQDDFMIWCYNYILFQIQYYLFTFDPKSLDYIFCIIIYLISFTAFVLTFITS